MPSGLNNTPSGSGAGGSSYEEENKKRHPKTSYKADYYYNRKMTTESGHEMEWDDTEQNPRIRMAHTSGSYFEYSKEGRKVESIKGHQYHYVQGGLTSTVDNNSDIKFNGNVRLSVGKGVHAEVNGQSAINVSKEIAISFGKSASIVTVDDMFIVAKNTTMKSDENFNVHCGKDMGIKCKGKFNVNTDGGVSVKTKGKFMTESTQETQFESKDKMTQKSQAKFSVMTQADYENEAKGTSKTTGKGGMTLTAPTIDLKK